LLNLKRLLTFTLTLMLILVKCPITLGADQTKIRNITIETAGDQLYDINSNTVTTKAHTKMVINDVTIEADGLTYYGNDNLTLAEGNVRLTQNKVTLTARSLAYQDQIGLVTATGDAQLKSETEKYASPLIRYNLNTLTGDTSRVQGVVTTGGRNYYLSGEQSQIDHGTTEIHPAGLTRCPNPGHKCYLFSSKKMRIKGYDVYLEKVTIKVLGVPVFYLPHLRLKQNDQAPSFDMTANEGDGPDLSGPGGGKTNDSELRSHWIYKIAVNTTRPSQLVVGRGYRLSRYFLNSKIALNSGGFFSLVDDCGVYWDKYYLTLDAKADLIAKPERELGLTLNRQTWDTGYGLLKLGLSTRLLYTKDDSQDYQGVYGAFRLDYQPFSLLSCTYFYLTDLSGTRPDWDKLEEDFMVLNNYRLGSNFMYNATIPLNPYYRIINKGSYNFDDSSWTTQSLGLDREVCCIKTGFSWDFAKEQLELRFKLSY
jgi:lipopolysaccharide assembly outer membrane protein LptD (OstA)